MFYAFEAGHEHRADCEITRIDPWFLNQIEQIVEMQGELKRFSLETVPAPVLREAKRFGFSDLQLGRALGDHAAKQSANAVAELGVRPVFKRVDTCAAEFESFTPYLYSTYEDEDEAEPTSTARRS